MPTVIDDNGNERLHTWSIHEMIAELQNNLSQYNEIRRMEDTQVWVLEERLKERETYIESLESENEELRFFVGVLKAHVEAGRQ